VCVGGERGLHVCVEREFCNRLYGLYVSILSYPLMHFWASEVVPVGVCVCGGVIRVCRNRIFARKYTAV